MAETALSIKNLKKVYKNGTEALKGIDLEVKKGDFFALLGPNGAGKSTAINIIVSLVNKTSGKIEVFGNDIDKELEEAKSHIGIVPQEFNFNIFEKTFDILVQQAGYYGVPKKLAEERAEKYLKKLGLWEKRNSAAREISGGQKRRLMIARSLVHEPELLILDEPTAGADIEVRKIIWDFMKELNKSGKTIILTTHYFEEAENLCRNVAIINQGNIIANMPMKNLLAKLDKESYIFDLKAPIKTVPQLPHHKITVIDDTTIEIETTKNENINLLFNYLNKNNIEVLSMKRKANKLEHIFLELINNKK